MTRKLMGLALVIIMLASVFLFAGCNKSLSNEEHIQNITQKIEQRFMIDSSEYAGYYESFSVEILYNYKDEPVYFLVEFHPDGFMYGRIHKNDYYYFDDYYKGVNTFFRGSRWKETANEENGWYIDKESGREWHYKSHFNYAGIISERKYLFISINIKNGGVLGIDTAVKRNGLFIDLISGENDSVLNRFQGDDDFSRKARRTWTKL